MLSPKKLGLSNFKTADFGLKVELKNSTNLGKVTEWELISVSIAILGTFSLIDFAFHLEVLSIITFLVSFIGFGSLLSRSLNFILQYTLSIFFLLICCIICFVWVINDYSGNLHNSTSCKLSAELKNGITGTSCEFDKLWMVLCGQMCFLICLTILVGLILISAWKNFEIPYINHKKIKANWSRLQFEGRHRITFWQCYVSALGALFILTAIHTVIMDFLVGIPLLILLFVAGICWLFLKPDSVIMSLSKTEYSKPVIKRKTIPINNRKRLILSIILTLSSLAAVVCVSIRIKQLGPNLVIINPLGLGAQSPILSKLNENDSNTLENFLEVKNQVESNNESPAILKVDSSSSEVSTKTVIGDNELGENFWEKLENQLPEDFKDIDSARSLRNITHQNYGIHKYKLKNSQSEMRVRSLLTQGGDHETMFTALIMGRLSIASQFFVSIIFIISSVLLLNSTTTNQHIQKLLQDYIIYKENNSFSSPKQKPSVVDSNLYKSIASESVLKRFDHSDYKMHQESPESNQKTCSAQNNRYGLTDQFVDLQSKIYEDKGDLIEKQESKASFYKNGSQQQKITDNYSSDQYEIVNPDNNSRSEEITSFDKHTTNDEEELENQNDNCLLVKSKTITDPSNLLADFDPSIVVDRSLVEEYDQLGETVIPSLGKLHVRVPSLIRTVQKLHFDYIKDKDNNTTSQNPANINPKVTKTTENLTGKTNLAGLISSIEYNTEDHENPQAMEKPALFDLLTKPFKIVSRKSADNILKPKISSIVNDEANNQFKNIKAGFSESCNDLEKNDFDKTGESIEICKDPENKERYFNWNKIHTLYAASSTATTSVSILNDLKKQSSSKKCIQQGLFCV